MDPQPPVGICTAWRNIDIIMLIRFWVFLLVVIQKFCVRPKSGAEYSVSPAETAIFFFPVAVLFGILYFVFSADSGLTVISILRVFKVLFYSFDCILFCNCESTEFKHYSGFFKSLATFRTLLFTLRLTLIIGTVIEESSEWATIVLLIWLLLLFNWPLRANFDVTLVDIVNFLGARLAFIIGSLWSLFCKVLDAAALFLLGVAWILGVDV